MKTYKAIFKTSSVCTAIPEAQTVFGAFCQALLMSEGEEQLQEYLSSFEKEPWFVHTSMFPEGCFPAAKAPIWSLQDTQQFVNASMQKERLSVLNQLKQLKKVPWFSQGVFERYVLNGSLQQLRKDIGARDLVRISMDPNGVNRLQLSDENSKSPFQMAQRLRIQNAVKGLREEKSLFYQPEIFFSRESRFAMFVKSNAEPSAVERWLKKLEITAIGPGGSSGLNHFEFECLQEIDLKSSAQLKCLLSPCIPKDDEFDFGQSFYELDSHIFRGSNSYVQDAFTGRYSCLKPGSLMKPAVDTEYYGAVYPMNVQGRTVYHYGIGVCL